MSTLYSTSGSIGVCCHVSHPVFRAETRTGTPGKTQLDWAYLGGTSTYVPLDDGIIRRQLGLKLRSANPCNLLYVMRELYPKSRVFVQAKINRGQDTSDECGSKGYLNLASVDVPAISIGKLECRFSQLSDGEHLEVRENGGKVIDLLLTGDAAKVSGVFGVRSDNIRWFFKLTP